MKFKSRLSLRAVKRVSLFTREWIEITRSCGSHPRDSVSLFTREWIEISRVRSCLPSSSVSLFTREWIEIPSFATNSPFVLSPSSRGSGLKWNRVTLKQQGWLFFTIPEHIRRIRYDQLIIASRPASFL